MKVVSNRRGLFLLNEITKANKYFLVPRYGIYPLCYDDVPMKWAALEH